tara:strand:- start:169 stop:642 length:474 start_codon:yes stop_codon:yes gene_type:complete
MDPKVWGPHGWQFLHSITLAYPDNPTLEDKNNHAQFFNGIQNILPCQRCRDHYSLSLQELPVEQHLENKESLFRWLVDIHNRVNVKNNKREYSYDEVTKLYEKMYDKSNDNTYGKSNDKSGDKSNDKSVGSKLIGNKWLFIFLIVLLIILGIYHYSK